jgi:catechol 2,3-dioxygenase-like lactoylglutathione lyase family enzyme
MTLGQLSLRFWAVAVSIGTACSSPHASVGHASTERDAAVQTAADAASESRSRKICTGCTSDNLDLSDQNVRFHHVHLNVNDSNATRDFYMNIFAAEPVRINGVTDALWLAPMLLLMHSVADAPADPLEMGLDHFGHGADDPVAWFDNAASLGVVGDTRTGFPGTPQQFGNGVPPDGFTYVYMRGPTAERLEVYTVGTINIPGHENDAQQFQHVHLLSDDVDGTVAWYSQLLDLPAGPNSGLGREIVVDRVSLFFASLPLPDAFVPTDDRSLGHLALSVTDLDRMRVRAGTLGVEIVSEPALRDEGFRSFFVRAPQEVLLEFVEASALADSQ